MVRFLILHQNLKTSTNMKKGVSLLILLGGICFAQPSGMLEVVVKTTEEVEIGRVVGTDSAGEKLAWETLERMLASPIIGKIGEVRVIRRFSGKPDMRKTTEEAQRLHDLLEKYASQKAIKFSYDIAWNAPDDIQKALMLAKEVEEKSDKALTLPSLPRYREFSSPHYERRNPPLEEQIKELMESYEKYRENAKHLRDMEIELRLSQEELDRILEELRKVQKRLRDRKGDRVIILEYGSKGKLGKKRYYLKELDLEDWEEEGKKSRRR